MKKHLQNYFTNTRKLKFEIFVDWLPTDNCYVELDDKIKEMIVERASEEEIAKYAYEFKGYRPLREDGFLKCIEGTTSLEEVLRVTSE